MFVITESFGFPIPLLRKAVSRCRQFLNIRNNKNYIMKILEHFEIKIDNRIFYFELREDGMVFLVDNENQKSNYGQVKGVYSLEKAKELAKEMLFISGKIKK